MTTHITVPSARPNRRRVPLRALAAAGALAPLLALVACSGDGPIAPTSQAATTQDVATTTPEATDTTPVTQTTTALPGPTEKAVSVVLKDPVLGHTIKALRLIRNVPWPAGHPVSEQSFEIVAVEYQVTAGSRYSADVQPGMITLSTGGPAYTRPTTEFGNLKGAPLATAKRGKTTKGWLYYKIPRGQGAKLVIMFHRPAYKVSTTGKSIPAKVLRTDLT